MIVRPGRDHSKDTAEVVVRGLPGSFVGLAAWDDSLSSFQTGNTITYDQVMKKFTTFTPQHDRTLQHTWLAAKQDQPDDFIHFGASSYGIDANRTFE